MRKILGLLFISFSMFSMQLDLVSSKSKVNRFQEKLSKQIDSVDKVHIKPASIVVPNRLGSVELYHSKKGFYVRQDDKKYAIKKYFTDPMLQNITKTQLKAFLANGYLTINQMEDGEYSLKAKGRMVGGGAIGAAIGACVGKVAVSLVGHGAIQIIALCTGPAYIPTVIALETFFGVQIEAATMAGAVAGGIALGVATGPV